MINYGNIEEYPVGSFDFESREGINVFENKSPLPFSVKAGVYDLTELKILTFDREGRLFEIGENLYANAE